MKCRNLNTEVIYNISACGNISRALSSFGIHNDTSYVLIAIIAPTQSKLQLVRNQIIGDELHDVPASLFRKCDFTATRLAYNIDRVESNSNNLIDCIVTRISCKQVL